MKKLTKLKICDWSLLAITVVMLLSSIQLEATHCEGVGWVIAHIMLGMVFMGGIVWHLYLHFQWKSWLKRLRSQKSPVTRWLAVFGLLTLLTAIVAMVHWLTVAIHSPVGGVHGKLGFIFIALVIGHTVKMLKFFRRK